MTSLVATVTTLLVTTLLVTSLLMLRVTGFVARQPSATLEDGQVSNTTVNQSLDSINAASATIKTIKFDHSARTLEARAVNRDFHKQLHKPYGFVSDTLRNKLLWTSSGDQTFKRASLDGKNIEIIRTNFEKPYSIERFMPIGREVFYLGDGAIRKKIIDHQIGEESDWVILKINPQQQHGLGFDQASRTLYLGDQVGQPSIEIVLDSDFSKPITVRRLVAN